MSHPRKLFGGGEQSRQWRTAHRTGIQQCGPATGEEGLHEATVEVRPHAEQPHLFSGPAKMKIVNVTNK